MKTSPLFRSILLASLSAALLNGCAGFKDQPQANRAYYSASDYVQLAGSAQGTAKQQYLLRAANQYIRDRNTVAASQVLAQIDPNQLSPALQIKQQLLQANILVLDQQNAQAMQLLTAINSNNPILPPNEEIALRELLAYLYQQQGNALNSVEQRNALQPLLPTNSPAAQKNLADIWQTLQGQSVANLTQWQAEANNRAVQGWLTLTLITKEVQRNPNLLAQRLEQWREQYPRHMANRLLPKNIDTHVADTNTPTQIALLLPLTGKLSGSSNAIRNGFFAAYYQTKKNNPQAPAIKVYNTSGKNVAAVYQTALNQGANFVVGPLTKSNVRQLAESGDISVPTLALNTLNSDRKVNDLYQFGLSPIDEAFQAANKAWSDQHHEALVIAPSNAWGQRIATAFSKEWQNLGGLVVGKMRYTNQSSLSRDVKDLLNVNQSQNRYLALRRILGKKMRFIARRRKDADVVFLIAQPTIARQIRPLLKFYFAGDLPVYAISSIYRGLPNRVRDRDLNGIQFCDMPWVLTPNTMQPQWLDSIRKQVRAIWDRSFTRHPKLYALGVDAFDVIPMLSKMTLLPEFGTDAATGTLYLTADSHIYRKLLWSQFRNGTPHLLQT